MDSFGVSSSGKLKKIEKTCVIGTRAKSSARYWARLDLKFEHSHSPNLYHQNTVEIFVSIISQVVRHLEVGVLSRQGTFDPSTEIDLSYRLLLVNGAGERDYAGLSQQMI